MYIRNLYLTVHQKVISEAVHHKWGKLKNVNNFKDTENSYRRGRHLYDKKTANNRNRTVNGKGNAETVDYLHKNWNRKQACYTNIDVKFFTSVIKKYVVLGRDKNRWYDHL